MDQALTDVPRLRRPALVNAAQYWLAPEQFAQRCQRLGDRFLVPMPATRAVAMPDRSRGHQARLHSRHRRASPRSGAGQGICAPSLPRPDRTHEPRRRRAHAQATNAAPPVPGARADRLPRDDAAQDRRGSRALALRAPHSLPAAYGSDQPRGDHGHGVRGHRPRARRAVALGDARAASRGPLAAVLPPDDDRDQPPERVGQTVPANPPRDRRGRRDRDGRGRPAPRRRPTRWRGRARNVPAHTR